MTLTANTGVFKSFYLFHCWSAWQTLRIQEVNWNTNDSHHCHPSPWASISQWWGCHFQSCIHTLQSDFWSPNTGYILYIISWLHMTDHMSSSLSFPACLFSCVFRTGRCTISTMSTSLQFVVEVAEWPNSSRVCTRYSISSPLACQGFLGPHNWSLCQTHRHFHTCLVWLVWLLLILSIQCLNLLKSCMVYNV